MSQGFVDSEWRDHRNCNSIRVRLRERKVPLRSGNKSWEPSLDLSLLCYCSRSRSALPPDRARLLLAMAANTAEKALALEQCERDLDSAIERLVNLRLDAAADQHDGYGDGGGAGAHHHHGDDVHPATAATAEEEEEQQRTVIVGAVHHVPSTGGSDGDDRTRGQWIDRLVEAMATAGSWDDARARAARLLEEFGASVSACRAGRERERERDVAVSQNGVLKKAVLVQQRVCREKDAANRALQRQLAACQDRVRSLETDNYALSLYLRNAQPRPQITGRFHPPEVF